MVETRRLAFGESAAARVLPRGRLTLPTNTLRLLTLGAAALLAGCSTSFEPCALEDVIELPEGASYGSKILVADESGYLVFWARPSSPRPDQRGVWVTRPGQTPVRLIEDADSDVLAVAPVTTGHLLCWVANGRSACAVMDGTLSLTGTPVQSDIGVVSSVGRTNEGLVARGLDLSADWSPVLFRIDENGAAVTSAAPDRCATSRGQAAAWSTIGLACLVPSDPLCGTQFDEPAGCLNDLHVYDSSGALSLFVPGVAPYGYYQGWVDVGLAAHDDGYLVAWSDSDGWHAQPIDAAGTPGASVRREIADPPPSGFALHAVESGYAAVVTERLGQYSLPQLLLLDAQGLVGDAISLDGSEGPLTRQYAHTAITASAGSSLALVWDGDNGLAGGDEVWGSRFRSLECPQAGE